MNRTECTTSQIARLDACAALYSATSATCVSIGIGHGSYRAVDLKQEPNDDQKPKLNKEIVRAIIESRIKGETGLSFESVEELIDCLRKLNDRIGSHSNVDLKPPLLRMCDDLERLIPTGAITSNEQAS